MISWGRVVFRWHTLEGGRRVCCSPLPRGLFDRARSDVTVAIKVQEKSRLAEFGGVDRVVAERNLHLQLEAGGSCAFIVKMLGAFQVSSAAGFLNAQRKVHGRVLIRA